MIVSTDWMTHLPPELVEQHLNISPATLNVILGRNYTILPK
jgi:hypothetical protein